MAEGICIKGGEVFFSENKTIHKKDILISDGKIFRIEDEIQPDGSVRIVNATNKLVTPKCNKQTCDPWTDRFSHACFSIWAFTRY
jgi:predicted amidohydrolase